MLTNPLVWGVLLLGIGLGYYIRQTLASRQANSVERKIKVWLEEAQTQAKEVVLQAKDRAAALFEEVKKEEKERKAQIAKYEERLLKKEESMEKQLADLGIQKSSIEKESTLLNAEKAKTDELQKKILNELEKVSKLSFDEAKEQLLGKIRKDYSSDLAMAVQKLEKERREDIENKKRQRARQKIGVDGSHIMVARPEKNP